MHSTSLSVPSLYISLTSFYNLFTIDCIRDNRFDLKDKPMNRYKKIRQALCWVVLWMFTLPAFSQKTDNWTSLPKEKWPVVALANHVKFKNGDRYIDPSFLYGATGFLIEYNGKKYGVTAKHVLWIARNKKSNAVEVNDELDHWIMKPKNSSGDSVVIDKLLNEDSTEVLQGSTTSILERDMLVFSTRFASPTLSALKPRFSKIASGEKAYVIGNPYNEPATIVMETKVVDKLGMDILLEQGSGSIGGFSGSPIVDANGNLIGVFSSVTSYYGKPVLVAISTEYLKDILDGKKNINQPKKDYGELILNTTLTDGTSQAITLYKKLIGRPGNFYKYNLRSANRNGLLEAGIKLMEMNKIQEAIEILEFNVKVNSTYFHNYNVLAKAYLKAGKKDKAVENFRLSTEKFDDKEENEAYGELEKLGR
jgi:hypothetical protein